jgi:hypothetical protein
MCGSAAANDEQLNPGLPTKRLNMHLESSVYPQSSVRPNRSRSRRLAARLATVGAAIALATFGMVIPAKHLAPVPGPEAAFPARVANAGDPAIDESSALETEQPRTPARADVAQDPRECDPAKGITSACIFE